MGADTGYANWPSGKVNLGELRYSSSGSRSNYCVIDGRVHFATPGVISDTVSAHTADPNSLNEVDKWLVQRAKDLGYWKVTTHSDVNSRAQAYHDYKQCKSETAAHYESVITSLKSKLEASQVQQRINAENTEYWKKKTETAQGQLAESKAVAGDWKAKAEAAQYQLRIAQELCDDLKKQSLDMSRHGFTDTELATITGLRNDNYKLRENLDTAQRAMSSSSCAAERIANHRNKLQKDLDDITELHKGQMTNIERLHKERDEAADKIQKLAAAHGALSQMHDKQRVNIYQMQDDARAAALALKERSVEIQTLKDRLKQMEELHDALRAMKAEATDSTHVTNLAFELGVQANAVVTLEAENATLRGIKLERDSFRTEVTKLKGKLEEAVRRENESHIMLCKLQTALRNALAE